MKWTRRNKRRIVVSGSDENSYICISMHFTRYALLQIVESAEFLKNKNAFNLVNNKIYVIMDTYGENYARNDGDV